MQQISMCIREVFGLAETDPLITPFRILMCFACVLPVVLIFISWRYYVTKQRNMRKRLDIRIGRQSRGNSNPEDDDIEAYMKNRIDPTIMGYSSKATTSSIFYTCITVLQITYSAMIPIVIFFPTNTNSFVVSQLGKDAAIAIIGGLVTIASGISAACKFKEKWLQYLGLRDMLFAERSLFTAGAVYQGLWRYDNDESKYNFVEKCESIIALEYRNLAENLSKPEDITTSNDHPRAGGNGK